MSVELQPLYAQKVTCPICTHSFTTLKVRSRFAKATQTDSDFCPHYSGANPLYYLVDVCPECGYASTQQFSKKIPEHIRSVIIQQICQHWQKRSYSEERSINQVIVTYKLALLSASLKEEKHVVKAGLCLRLGWLFRFQQDEANEQRFLKLALQEYEHSYNISDFEGYSMSEMKVLYMIGELARRVGDYPMAFSYFIKVTEHINRHVETGIVKMARDQWQLTREESPKIEGT